MSKARKRLTKAKNNPNGWHFEDLKSLYEAFGFEVSSAKGSHHHAKHPSLKFRLTFIKHSTELPPAYIRDAVEAIEELLNIEGDKGEDNESE